MGALATIVAWVLAAAAFVLVSGISRGYLCGDPIAARAAGRLRMHHQRRRLFFQQSPCAYARTSRILASLVPSSSLPHVTCRRPIHSAGLTPAPAPQPSTTLRHVDTEACARCVPCTPTGPQPELGYTYIHGWGGVLPPRPPWSISRCVPSAQCRAHTSQSHGIHHTTRDLNWGPYSVRGRLYVMPAPQLRRSALLITALGHWALRSRTTAMPTGGGSTALRSPGSDDSALLSALFSSRAPLLPPSLPSGRKASFFLGHLPRIMRTGSPSLFALLTKRHGPVFKVGKNTQG